MPAADDLVSFVVPAHNEAPLLARTLRAIDRAADAAGLACEVVVVDDGSIDGTGSIARALGARVVTVAFRQIARTRNAGARAARGGVFIFVDADTIITPDVLDAVITALRHGAIGGGAIVDFDRPLPVWARALIPALRGAMTAAHLAAGCFLFCTREAFEAAGGFDESLFAAEEIALSRALGRHGRFVIVKARVTTSGRKLRLYSGWEMLRLVGHLVACGTRGVRSRDKLAMWYGERRHDPLPPP